MPIETIAWLLTDIEGTYIDCTLGGGGHASRILQKLGPAGKLVGIDQDEAAIAHVQELWGGDPRVTLIRTNFENVKACLEERNLLPVQGMLFDLGVSSPQLDQSARGFSYKHDAPLDMRMNPDAGLTAAQIINTRSEADLTRIMREYGEERWASRIAHFVVQRRRQQPIETTGQLVDLIKAAIPAAARRQGPHPAKRTFQALRIEVNRELEVLSSALDQALVCLGLGGRLAVITFHSLEEKIVTQKIRSWLGRCVCPPGLPECRCGARAYVRILTRKPLAPSPKEIAGNPRARSAKLRVVEKTVPV